MNVSKEVKEAINIVYTKMTNREFAEILKIPVQALENKHVSILSVEQLDFTLVLFHYSQHIDSDRIKNLYSEIEYERICSIRGVIVHLEERKVVCKSYPLTKNIRIDGIPNVETEDVSSYISCSNDYMRNLFSTDIKLNKYIIGTLIRVFSVDGFTYYSTHKKIDSVNSKFNSDETFKEKFFKYQNCFTSEHDLVIRPNHVAVFIISYQGANIDSPEFIEDEYVTFIGGFRIENGDAIIDEGYEEEISRQIEHANESASLKIRFPELISLSDANSLMNPHNISIVPTKYDETISEIIETIPKQPDYNTVVRFFSRGSKIILKSSFNGGTVVSLVPSSAMRRMILTEGKIDPFFMYCKCIGHNNSRNLFESMIMINKGYSIDDLRLLLPMMQNDEQIDFASLPDKEASISEVIITNLFFTCSKEKLEEILGLKDHFDNLLVQCVNFLELQHEETLKRVQSDNFADYPVLHSAKLLRENFRKRYVWKTDVNNERNSKVPPSFWPKEIKKMFKSKKRSDAQKIKFGIVDFVITSNEDSIYSLLQMKSKFIKTQAAWEESKLKTISESG